jgi:tripartite-type tricarboxylate transporter receptor subunit TctC
MDRAFAVTATGRRRRKKTKEELMTARSTAILATRRRLLLCAGAGAALGCVPLRANSAPPKFPDKPVTFVVPFPAGSGSDVFVRTLVKYLTPELGVAVIVDDRPGGSNMLAARQVAAAKPGDGHLVFLGNNSLWMVQPVIEPSAGYTFADFDHIMMLGETPYILVSRPDRGWTKLKDLVDEAKRRPGQISFGSTGNGGMLHLIVERLMATTGIKLLHVPYRGSAQAQADLLGGQIDLMFDSVPSARALVTTKRLQPLAVSSTTRLTPFPDVPTVAEQGYPDYSAVGWWSLETPAGTPATSQETLRRAFAAALNTQEMKQFFVDYGLLAPQPTRQYLMDRIAAEAPVYRDLITRLGIKAVAS